MALPFQKTVDGIEAQFQVNHLSHFLLTQSLLDLLEATGSGRVINLSSKAHMRFPQNIDWEVLVVEYPLMILWLLLSCLLIAAL